MTGSQPDDSAKAPWTRTMVGCMGDSFGWGGFTRTRRSSPRSGLGDPCVLGRYEGPAVHLGAEAPGMNVGRHASGVAGRLQDAAGELVEPERFWARQLD